MSEPTPVQGESASALSPEALDGLRRIVAASIASGRTAWGERHYREIGVSRDVQDELARADLTARLMYEQDALTPEAVRIAMGWD